MTDQGGDVRALVRQIAETLVDSPQEVQVDQLDEDGATVIELTVAPNDVGKVIGRQGRIARALRTVVAAAGTKLHKHYELEILE